MKATCNAFNMIGSNSNRLSHFRKPNLTLSSFIFSTLFPFNYGIALVGFVDIKLNESLTISQIDLYFSFYTLKIKRNLNNFMSHISM